MMQPPRQSTGYLGQKRISPSSIAIVVALHGAGIAALLLAKPALIMPDEAPPVVVTLEPTLIEAPPPVPPDAPSTDLPPPPPAATNTRVRTERPPLPALPQTPLPPQPPTPLLETAPTPAPPPSAPVLTDARFHPSHMASLQPRYPSSLLRHGVEGAVTVRVRVETNGRVSAVQLVRADHNGFFEATRRHAIRYWRFEPATRDGQPVASWQQHVVHFRIT